MVELMDEELAMKKGQKKRVWTAEQKAEIVRKHLEEHVSVRTLEKEYQAERSMICRWVKRYIAEGESSFERKKPPGNRFAALHTSKNRGTEKHIMVAKLEIENERLKKGYWVEGAGASKEYVTGKGKNMKS